LKNEKQVVNVAATGLTIHNSESEVAGNQSANEYPLPTERERQTLRRVAGTLPLVSFSLCLVEFAERASYYGSKTVFSNFIQFPLPEGSTQFLTFGFSA
jgi:hypothetical protein